MSVTTTEATAELLEFVRGLEYRDCPTAAIRMAKKCIADTVGVTMAGVNEPPAEIVRDYVSALAADGEATVIGQESTFPPEYAALVNGVQGHAIDYDDVTYYTFSLHPSVTLVPTLLSVGEETHATGEELVAAFVAGFESEIRMPGGVGGQLMENGYHPTPVVGTFGSTVVAAKLFGLSDEHTRHAIGIAASLYSGLTENFGTMTKPLHAGLPNLNGIRAVNLAKRGFTANDRIMENPSGPWLYPYEEYNLAEWTADLGDTWYTAQGIGIKIYPTCGCTHGGIDAARDIHEGIDDGATIESITTYSTPAGHDQLKYHDPQTPLEAKFCMEYCVAAGLIDGNVNLAHFTEESVQRADIQQLVDRSDHRQDESLAADGYVSGGFPARVEVALTDGQTITREVLQPTGTADVEVTDDELETKFRNCVRKGGGEEAMADELFDSLMDIEAVEDINSLTGQMAT